MTKSEITKALKAAGLKTDVVGSAPKWFVLGGGNFWGREAEYAAALAGAGIESRMENGRLIVTR